MSEYYQYDVGETIKIDIYLKDGAVPVSGQTLAVFLRRKSDLNYYNWNLNTWETSATSAIMIEDIQEPGYYYIEFDQEKADNKVETYYARIENILDNEYDFTAIIEYRFDINYAYHKVVKKTILATHPVPSRNVAEGMMDKLEVSVYSKNNKLIQKYNLLAVYEKHPTDNTTYLVGFIPE